MWYVIQVKTGEESGIARKLKNQAIRAEVPIENRPIRSGGAWTKKEYILFPGYVFLDMDFTARNYHCIVRNFQFRKFLPVTATKM